jgi:hypothetical protein
MFHQSLFPSSGGAPAITAKGGRSKGGRNDEKMVQNS